MRSKLIPYVLLFLALLTIASILVTRALLLNVEREVNRTSHMIALLISELLVPSLERPQVGKTIQTVLQDVDFPIVVTDELGIPRAWHRIGVPPSKFTSEQLNRPDQLKDDPDFLKILKTIGRLKRLHEPIAIKTGDTVVGYLYYGLPPLVPFLHILPFALLVVGALAFLGLIWAARSVQDYTMKDFWASFAKGLAHQMGVPVSSLWGWVELLRQGQADPEVLQRMEQDLRRLSSILRRFSKIGGTEKLQSIDLAQVVEETVTDLRGRFLQGISVHLDLRARPRAWGDPELFSWALENLLKNAYEARNQRNPRIVLTLFVDEDEAVLRVSDNGRGIPKDKMKHLFKRSFSTKERGWGVGLLLVRRIVEEIHKGKIRLLHSEPYLETVFEIRLPLSQGGRIS